jgi:ribosome-binding ATPase YchF (GTP1/OBG family)
VGKSTLFNALTNSYSAPAENFPFCTIEPNVGIVDVKDPRIEKLSEISKTKKIIHANIEFVDIA